MGTTERRRIDKVRLSYNDPFPGGVADKRWIMARRWFQKVTGGRDIKNVRPLNRNMPKGINCEEFKIIPIGVSK